MKLFHTPRTSFLLTTRLWKHNSCSLLFLFQERTWERPLEPFWIPLYVSVLKSTTWNQNIDEKISITSPCRSLCSYLLAVGDVREYCILPNHCHIQILDLSHDFLNGFVSGLTLSSPPSSLPHRKSPLPYPFRKSWYSGYNSWEFFTFTYIRTLRLRTRGFLHETAFLRL